jgi:hypothetical protein
MYNILCPFCGENVTDGNCPCKACKVSDNRVMLSTDEYKIVIVNSVGKMLGALDAITVFKGPGKDIFIKASIDKTITDVFNETFDIPFLFSHKIKVSASKFEDYDLMDDDPYADDTISILSIDCTSIYERLNGIIQSLAFK